MNQTTPDLPQPIGFHATWTLSLPTGSRATFNSDFRMEDSLEEIAGAVIRSASDNNALITGLQLTMRFRIPNSEKTLFDQIRYLFPDDLRIGGWDLGSPGPTKQSKEEAAAAGAIKEAASRRYVTDGEKVVKDNFGLTAPGYGSIIDGDVVVSDRAVELAAQIWCTDFPGRTMDAEMCKAVARTVDRVLREKGPPPPCDAP